MEILTCTINHEEYLYHTLESFKKYTIDLKLNECILYLNVDPYPNNKNIDKLIELAKKYFLKVIYRVGNDFSAANGFIWAIPQIKNEVCFILGGGKTLCGNISINYMKTRLLNDKKAVQISCLNGNSKYRNYLTITPNLVKTNFLKDIFYKYAVPHVEVEYQLRELALLTNNN